MIASLMSRSQTNTSNLWADILQNDLRSECRVLARLSRRLSSMFDPKEVHKHPHHGSTELGEDDAHESVARSLWSGRTLSILPPHAGWVRSAQLGPACFGATRHAGIPARDGLGRLALDGSSLVTITTIRPARCGGPRPTPACRDTSSHGTASGSCLLGVVQVAG